MAIGELQRMLSLPTVRMAPLRLMPQPVSWPDIVLSGVS